MCVKVVKMIDPAAAQQCKDRAAKEARVERFQEYSGNAALCGRDLPPEEVLASSQHVDACARALRAAGLPGTLPQLRTLAFLDLTQGLDPLNRLTAADANATDQAPCQTDVPNSRTEAGPAGGSAEGDREEPAGEDDGDGHGPGGGVGRRPGGPPGPGGGARARPRDTAPVKAVITLLVPAGTLLGWSSAPGEVAGFGLLDPQATRDLTAAASHHPQTRWCVTVVGPDGTAAAHGCAPGRHPWTPGQHRTGGGGRDGPGPARDGPLDPGAAERAAQVTALLRWLRVRLAPIAKGHCDHRHYSQRYVISRTVKDLITYRSE